MNSNILIISRAIAAVRVNNLSPLSRIDCRSIKINIGSYLKGADGEEKGIKEEREIDMHETGDLSCIVLSRRIIYEILKSRVIERFRIYFYGAYFD
ncbi:hypothetical protein PUN28_018646 [Cardiocondyla obscurior]|uniref:Uncharacterized protein n=1 Tax=Cardiocondyla obscurior TaxID=286306 RepID=A0AAW2EIQ9_9HYME